MQTRWKQKTRDEAGFDDLVKELAQHEAWNVVPPERPYGSLAALLSAEIGRDFFAEPDFFSQVDETMRSLAGLHTSIAALTPAATADPEVDMAHIVAVCQAFAARCAEVEQALRQTFPVYDAWFGPPPPPREAGERLSAHDAPAILPYDAEKFVLGKLCRGKHEWGNTGQTLLRKNGRYCQRCNAEKKRQASGKERDGDRHDA